MLSSTCRRPLLLALIAALAACSPALNWREVRPESTALVVMFPCKPSRQTRELPLAGARVRMELLACEAGGATWALSHAQLGDPARVGASLAALNESLAANLGMGAAPDGVAWLVPGMTPQPQARRLQLRGQRADGVQVRVEAGVFSHGTQVFQVVVMQPAQDSAADGEMLQAFFGSLKVRV
jgi:hypothetical protein